ncbi:MAG: murein biosynthesis integral membrane protein MurJ [Proteobacteria bacterium]|nr:murein biosynthesis integral membrane protein MurJ [Pseudomonadota bacterium]
MSFIKSSAIVSLGTLTSRIFGFCRDLFMARFLGAGLVSDIFFIALRIPNMVRSVFGEGAFNMAFVPMFKNKCDGNKINQKALKFIEETFAILMLVITLITVGFEIFMPSIIDTLAPTLMQRGEHVFSLAVVIARILIINIVFTSYMTFMGAVLNSLGRFAAMAFAPALVNIGYISAFTFVHIAQIEVPNIVYIPAFGAVFGGGLQAFMMYAAIKRLPFTIKFQKPVITQNVKKLFFKFLPTCLGSGIVILNAVVSVFLASSLQKGSVSFLFYSDRIINLPSALVGTAVATVLLPTLTQKIKENKDISKAFNKVFAGTILISALGASYIYVFSDVIINTLFERGLFDRVSTNKTAAALSILAFALPGMMNLRVVSTVFYASGNTKVPNFISAISFVLNLSLCLILMKMYDYLGLVIAGVISLYFVVFSQVVILAIKRILRIKDILEPLAYYALFQVSTMLLFTQISRAWSISLDDNILFKLFYLVITGIAGAVFAAVLVFIFRLHKRYGLR